MKQEVLYVTEAAVFRLDSAGIILEEIAPGIAVDRDLIPQMGFEPRISPDLKLMPHELFLPEPLPQRLFGNFSSQPL